MCKMRVVVLREMLGSRETGWTLWSGKDVMEMTATQIKNCIKAGNKVCGLKIGESGNLEPDMDGFYCSNIMEHRHCGSYTPMIEEGCMANLFYICIGSHEEAGNTVYDCISTRFEQINLSEGDLRAYLKLGIVSAGAMIVDDKVVLASLEYEKKEEPKPLAGKDLFDRIKQEAASEAKQDNEPVSEEPKKVDEKPVAAEVEKQDPVKPEEKKVPEEATPQKKGNLPGKKK